MKVKRNHPLYYLEANVFFRKFASQFVGLLNTIDGKIIRVGARQDYVEEMLNRIEYDMGELSKMVGDIDDRISGIEDGVSGIEETLCEIDAFLKKEKKP